MNYNLFDILAEQIMEDLEITQDEIFLADNLCDILSISRSEFVSVLQNKSAKIISKFITSKSYGEISATDLEKIKNYYEFLNGKSLKYDVNIPIYFLNNYNCYRYKNNLELIGLKVDVGFPSMINFPLYGAYDGMVSKMKKVSGQNTFEQNPARVYNYGGALLVAYKYSFLDSFNGQVDSFNLSEIKDFGDRNFLNTGEKYLSIQKKGDRNPHAIAGLADEVQYTLIKECIKAVQRNKSIASLKKSGLDTKSQDVFSEKATEKEDTKKIEVQPNIKDEDYVSELNKLIGIEEVKSQIASLINFIKFQKLRSQKDLKTTNITLHTVFTGSPGTGKTTVARLYGGILKQLGVLKKGQLIEVDRSGLVAGYLGQTAIKVDEVINRALDGILFIDEAYSLANSQSDSYGEEAIDILLKRMEDNRERLVVILAGYTTEMEKFIDSNPGLKSRFSRYIKFDDYDTNELYGIFDLLCKENEYKLSGDASKQLRSHFDMIVSSSEKNFGNGRYVRNIFEKIVERHSNRIINLTQPTEEDMITFSLEDINV